MKNNEKKQKLIIAAVLLAMMAAIAVLALLNAPKDKAALGTLQVVRGEKEPVVLTLSQLQALPAVQISADMGSASSTGIHGVLKGAALREVLNHVDPALAAEGKRVYAYAQDGFVLTYNMDEILKDDSVIVAYEYNGAPMKSKDEGGEGPLRVVVAGDVHANRSCKYVYKIEVK